MTVNAGFFPPGSTDLGNGTEVENTLVPDPVHVAQNIGHVLQGVGDEQVEAVDSCFSVLCSLEVLQLSSKLPPRLRRKAENGSTYSKQSPHQIIACMNGVLRGHLTQPCTHLLRFI